MRGKTNKTKALMFGALIIALVAVLLVVTGGMVSAASQRWYLYDSDHHFPAGADCSYIMSHEKIGAEGTVAIQKDGKCPSVTWIADEAAAVDLTFPAGTWTGELDIRDGGGTCTVEVGKWVADGAGGGTFTPCASKTIDFAGASSPKNPFTIAAPALDIAATEYLACRVTTVTSQTLLHCGSAPDDYGTSWIEYPFDDPAYPLPELSAAILLGMGLLGLVALVGWKSLKASA